MKKTILLAGAMAMLATGALADNIFGIWQTIPDDNNIYGHIEVKQCGSTICGTLIKSFDAADNSPYQSDNIGKQLVWDMVNQGGGSYGGGKVHSPDRGKTYKGKMVLKGDSLTVKGCISIICRDGGTWSRVK